MNPLEEADSIIKRIEAEEAARWNWCLDNSEQLLRRAAELRDKWLAHCLAEHATHLEQYLAIRKKGKVPAQNEKIIVLIRGGKDHLDQIASWKLKPVEEWGPYMSMKRFLAKDITFPEILEFVRQAYGN